MELELRHLRILCTIADTLSLGRTATVLGCSQPAVSSQLMRIERLLGADLFVRGNAGVTPTRFGVEVVVRAREVVALADAIGWRSTAERLGAERVLRLAATNTPILPGLLQRARAVLPALTTQVSSVYSSAEIVALIEGGGQDVGVAVDYPGSELRHSKAVVRRGIVTEPSFVALPVGHPASARWDVSLLELAGDAWFLTPDDGAGWPGVCYEAFRAAGFSPAAVHEFLGDRDQLQRMIADGLGVSVVQATCKPYPGVVVKPLAGTPLWCRYVLVWHRERVSDEMAETLFGAALAAYEELIARAPHFQAWAARHHRTSRT
ncbi:LysR family transcriptional regulator [Streptomyces griseofuscus]|uniref:LysR family transcriptional regulator n=1 Tax=Streptomyces griseofuscus TaxID=146922 RepID=A0A7H1PRH0_9ACTN|nr:LysR family transcriptional regulator [Streptomyces griseofuscus]QNT90650.1 LysR family transcriptional regulator [Streptomyces griseofuscus]